MGATHRSVTRTSPAIALLLALAALTWAPAPAAAAPQLSWSAVSAIDVSGAPSAISCPSEALCVAVDGAGNVLTSTNPTASAPSWSVGSIDATPLTSVSCASAALCVAVDAGGRALVSTNPSGGAVAWLPPASIDEGRALTGVSCPTSSLCVAVDAAGNVLTSTEPGFGWAARGSAKIDASAHLRAVSCASASLCVAVDDAGNALASAAPTGGAGAWTAHRIDANPGLTAVSCQAVGYCIAGDEAGVTLASADPLAGAPTWSSTPIGPPSARLTSTSCTSSGLCVAVDNQGAAFAADDPTSPSPGWAESSADPARAPAAVSCLPTGLCVALDLAGGEVTARVHAPVATTETPAEVTDATAVLSGAVNPSDALVQQCWFEYGTSVSYGHTVPCASLPAPAGTAQPVSASVSGLLPNTTYHYRVLALSVVGSGTGLDVAFTTAVSSQIPLVYPHPSIAGTPASGQRLSCRPGTPAGAIVTLRYAWLRDLVPVPGASGSSYAVRDIDTGHHLQCQVTATDGGGSATARSAFVTVPVGGVPVSGGETFVGAARFTKAGVSVPITCSAQAQEGCRVTVRVILVETLRGGRIVGVAAESVPSRRGRAAAGSSGLRRITLSLGSARGHLSPGQRGAVLVRLSASAKRLLASRRRLPVEVSVSGTVIGVIEALLARERLVIARAAKIGSRHGGLHR